MPPDAVRDALADPESAYRVEIFGDTRMSGRSLRMEGVRHRVGLAAPLPMADKARQPP